MATITTGGTAQTGLAAMSQRKFWAIQNQSAGDLYVRDDGTAATATDACLKIPPGAYYETPPGYQHSDSAVPVIGATTGQAFWMQQKGG